MPPFGLPLDARPRTDGALSGPVLCKSLFRLANLLSRFEPGVEGPEGALLDAGDGPVGVPLGGPPSPREDAGPEGVLV